MKKNRLVILICILLILLLNFIGSTGELLENLNIPVAIGYDFNKESESKLYGVPIALYLFQSNKDATSTVISGEAKSIGETRESRHLKSTKKFLLGLERLCIISETQAHYTVRPIIDILMHNPQINDRALLVVCKGKAEDILKYPMKGYSNSGEYIEGMIKNATQFNFFSKNHTIMDLISKIDAEGRNSNVPYIELRENNLEITGFAIFKKDKMVGKTDIKEAKIINLLKENNVKGMLTIQKNPKEYINFYATSKRKVKCSKEDGKYKFVIDLNLKGPIVSNELYYGLTKNPKVLNTFEKDMAKSVEKDCMATIKKILVEYNVDVLDLGRIAAAKYGRETGVDWNKIICNSIIEVNAKVKVDAEGRGDY